MNFTSDNFFSSQKSNLKTNKLSVSRFSLENTDFEMPKGNIKLNSPRSLEALFKLGYTQDDLFLIPMKKFIIIHPNIRSFPKDLQKTTYEYFDSKRIQKIKESRIERRKLIERLESSSNINNLNYNNSQNLEKKIINSNEDLKRINSSKHLNDKGINIENFGTAISLKSTAVNNDIKQFERMKKKQELEIMAMLQNELKMEMIRKENEQKIQRKKEKEDELKKHYQNQIKIEDEKRLKIEKDKQEKMVLDEEQRKRQDQLRYLEAQEKLKKDFSREKERIKENRKKQEEEKKKQEEFKLMIEKMLNENKKKAEQRQKIMELRENERQEVLEKKRLEKIEINMRKSMQKQEKIKINMKNLDEKINFQREKLTQKQIDNDTKRKSFEELRELAFKKRKIQSAKRAEDIVKVLEKNDYIEKQRLQEYKEKQSIIISRKFEIEEMQKEMKKMKEEKNEYRENEIRERMDKYFADEERRKMEIMERIEIHDYKIKNLQTEKERENMEKSEMITKKRIEKEENIKRIGRLQDYDRSKVLERLQDKNYKVEEFVFQKSLIADKKREMQQVINQKKNELLSKFDKVFKKKNMDVTKNLFFSELK